MTQALYRKWRPQLWDEVVGQDHVVHTLRNALKAGRIAHAYLFSGPRGCGKTTSARLIAKALNCLQADPAQRPCNTCENCVAVNEGRFLDLIEIDGASNNSVENIRDLRDKINFSPSKGRYKIYIIDEVHMLSIGAFNALLKTLEEPPPHAIFILATTENHKIPPTVTSRCQRFEFRRIPIADIVARLKTLCVNEGLNVDERALELVARQATGALRDAISLLDQLVAADTTVSLEQAQAMLGAAASVAVTNISAALTEANAAQALQHVSQAMDAGTDPRQLARQLVDYLRSLLLVRLGNANQLEVTADLRTQLTQQAPRWTPARLLRAIRAFNAAANETRTGWQPQLPLELAIIETLAEPETETTPAPTPRTVEARPATVVPTVSPTPAAPATSANEARALWEKTLTLLIQRRKITQLNHNNFLKCTVSWHGQTFVAHTDNKIFHDKASERPDIFTTIGHAISEVAGGNPITFRLQLAETRQETSLLETALNLPTAHKE